MRPESQRWTVSFKSKVMSPRSCRTPTPAADKAGGDVELSRALRERTPVAHLQETVKKCAALGVVLLLAATAASWARAATKVVEEIPAPVAIAGDVFVVNRTLAGRTPLRVANLRAGSHLIWIEREGYRRWTCVGAVAADRVARVTAELAPSR